MARGAKNHLLCKALYHKFGKAIKDAPDGYYLHQCLRCKEWVRSYHPYMKK